MEKWYDALVKSKMGDGQLLWQEEKRSGLVKIFEGHDNNRVMVKCEWNEKAVYVNQINMSSHHMGSHELFTLILNTHWSIAWSYF